MPDSVTWLLSRGCRTSALAAAATDAAEGAGPLDPLSVEVGYALVALVDEKQGGSLLTRVRAIRRQIAADTGMVVPPVHVADNLQLGPRQYTILVKGVEVARGELYADRLLAINPGTAAAVVDGVPTREPAFGLPAVWIGADQRDRASAAGYTVVDPTTALSTHASETIRVFLPDLLSRQHTKELVDRVAQTSPKLVEELVPKIASIGDIQRVLRQLLRERVSIRDLTTILEAIADAAPGAKDADAVAEAVRQAIGRTICRPAGLPQEQPPGPRDQGGVREATRRADILQPLVEGRLPQRRLPRLFEHVVAGRVNPEAKAQEHRVVGELPLERLDLVQGQPGLPDVRGVQGVQPEDLDPDQPGQGGRPPPHRFVQAPHGPLRVEHALGVATEQVVLRGDGD